MKYLMSRQRMLTLLLAVMVLPFRLWAETPPKEGMWIPLLLDKYNEAEMKSMGLKLSAEDIFSVNKSSLKDAVVSFGGFCTAEVISSEGLLLTNHHCGFGQVQAHSTPEHDYLKNGFWAMKREDELANPGLTATFIISIEDVTEKVLDGVPAGADDAERERMIAKNIAAIEESAIAGTHYQANIKPFFYGNEYYLFTTETFRDVRLVGAPPSGIGKFGGDTDNWMWPRHTGDFSMFRIYAGPDNKPADYSPDNVPFKPRHHFTISLKGIKKGDFTMVYGFPGRTSEYLHSSAVDYTLNTSNPAKIALREKALEVIDAGMQESDKIRIQYAAKQARIANYWKKWLGESRGLRRLDAIEKKKSLEAEFAKWVTGSADRKKQYGDVLQRLEGAYIEMKPLQLVADYLNEAAFRLEIVDLAWQFDRHLYGPAEKGELAEESLERLRGIVKSHFKDYHQPIDHKVAVSLMPMYYNGLTDDNRPPVLDDLQTKYKGDWQAWADYVFDKSVLADEERALAFIDKAKSTKAVLKLGSDPAFSLMKGVLQHYREQIAPMYFALREKIDALMKTYVDGLRKMQKNKHFYPDANSTLRLTYGQIDDYQPRDGVDYGFQTTLEGIMQKHVPGDVEFDAPARLLELYKNKDYGRYAMKDGNMPVCFTASNHTTGGNSGSPVLNGDGHLIGTNFDRNWEGTMSDIMYDPDMCRNISVDIRYTLFVVDKVAGASHLIKEMTIVE